MIEFIRNFLINFFVVKPIKLLGLFLLLMLPIYAVLMLMHGSFLPTVLAIVVITLAVRYRRNHPKMKNYRAR